MKKLIPMSPPHHSAAFQAIRGSRKAPLRAVAGFVFAVVASLLGGWWVLAADSSLPLDPDSTFFMGRVNVYKKGGGNDCSSVGKELMKLVSEVSTLKVRQEKRLRLSDPEVFETPFLFMNGHNDFVLGDEDVASVKAYFEHGGFLFASGCCTNPKFPEACRREFGRIFEGESIRPLPYSHPIYRSFYLVSEVRSLHEKKDIQLEGLFYQGNLVMVLGEDGLCCAFSMSNRCNAGKGVGPEDGKRLALNIAVYALTH